MSHHRYPILAGGLCLLILLATGLPAVAHEKPEPPVAADAEQTAAGTWFCPMCETVRQDRPGRCPICRMELHREGVAATIRPTMPGAPSVFFFGGTVVILVLSFLLFESRGRRDRSAPRRRFNLFRLVGLRALLRHRWFLAAVRLPMVLLLGVILFAGFFGSAAPERNIAPVLTWTIWWTWIVVVILFLGKIWCTACPWIGIADWIERRMPERRSPRRRWPKSLRNIWIATAMFVGLTWLELGYGVTERPWLTALLGVFMTVAAVGTVLAFERKGFCRYACPVGRISGLYAMFAPTELRAENVEVCRRCRTRDCYRGNDRGQPCPTHQFLGSMRANTYCTLCTECLKTCPEDNVAWNLRPFGSDLVETKRIRVDEGILAVTMLSMSAFHGLTMTPAWDRLLQWIREMTGVGELSAFSLGMTAMLVAPPAAYYGVCALMKWATGDTKHSAGTLFVRFACSLLPIALFYHLAHNLQHVFYEGMKIVKIASDPFGWGWNLFGTARMPIDAVLPVEVGWWIQVALIVIGHVYGILIAHRIAHQIYPEGRSAAFSQVPMLVGMAAFSFQSLWLVAQPMLMRTAM